MTLPDVVIRSVANTPAAFLRISRNLDQYAPARAHRGSEVELLPFIYDQKLYADAGARRCGGASTVWLPVSLSAPASSGTSCWALIAPKNLPQQSETDANGR